MPLREHHRAAARDIMRTTIDRSEADRPGAATAALAGGEPEYLDWGRADSSEPPCHTLATLGAVEREYAAIHSGIGLVDASQRGLVLVSGSDAMDLLERMVTAKVGQLKPGMSAAGFLLERTGRIQSDVLLIHSDHGVLLDVDRRDVGTLVSAIDAMTFSEDVVVAAGDDWYTLEAHGPGLEALMQSFNTSLPECGCVASCDMDGRTATVSRWDTAGVAGVRIHVRLADVLAVWETLHARGAKAASRCRTVGWLAFNMARVEARTPWWHIDFGTTSLPHETGLLADRVSFTKGCYPGQEVVARLENLGHPKQMLRVLPMPDQRLPIAGGQVFADEDGPAGNPIGSVTSSAPSPMRGGASTVLAVLKWSQSPLGTTVRCVAEGELVRATVEAVATSAEEHSQ
jgi:folate-binding protein YgfZ